MNSLQSQQDPSVLKLQPVEMYLVLPVTQSNWTTKVKVVVVNTWCTFS